jgi:hypothetical protein
MPLRGVSYLANKRFRQYGSAVLLSTTICSTAFTVSIAGVVQFCAEKQVLRIYTRWIVTVMQTNPFPTAFVVHHRLDVLPEQDTRSPAPWHQQQLTVTIELVDI